jgi:hypothetical protein
MTSYTKKLHRTNPKVATAIHRNANNYELRYGRQTMLAMFCMPSEGQRVAPRFENELDVYETAQSRRRALRFE